MTHFTGKAAKVLVLAAVTTLLLAVSAMAAEEDMAIAVGATTGSSLRLRAEASTSASIVTTLDKGVAVAVLDGSADGWYQINYAGNKGFVSADYLIIDQDNIFESYGKVNAEGVNVREGASTDSAVLASVGTGTVVTVTGFADGWYAVTCQYGTKGYIRSDFLDLTSSSTSSSGSSIVDTAKQYLGTRYSYGGASPSGFDCSGFTQYVMRACGYSIYRTATDQLENGYAVSYSDLQPGDLVFFERTYNTDAPASHVGIYVGGGEFIHAGGSYVKISSLSSDYYASRYVGARRIV